MKITSIVVGVVACAGAAHAQFDVQSVDNLSLGAPIGLLGNLSNPLNSGPNPDDIDAQPALAYSTYLAVDTAPSSGGNPGTSGDGHWANPGGLVPNVNPFTNPNQLAHTWFAQSLTSSAPQTDFDGQHGIFIGRFSFIGANPNLAEGALVLGIGGIYVDISDPGTLNVGSPATDSLLVRFNSFNTPVQVGLDGADSQTYATGYTYALKLNSFRATLGDSNYFVHDLYVVQVPAPSSALALGGLAILSRRRRR